MGCRRRYQGFPRRLPTTPAVQEAPQRPTYTGRAADLEIDTCHHRRSAYGTLQYWTARSQSDPAWAEPVPTRLRRSEGDVFPQTHICPAESSRREERVVARWLQPPFSKAAWRSRS